MARARGRSVKREVAALQLTRSDWLNLIEEWVLSERDRYIVRRHILDGRTYSQINDELEEMGEYPLSDRRLGYIISHAMDILTRHI